MDTKSVVRETRGSPNVKHDRIGKIGVTTKDDLKTKATNALRRLQKLPALVRSFFHDPNLSYITA